MREVELNPQLGKELTILATSPPLPGNALVVFRPGLDPGLQARVLKACLTIHQHPTGKQILTLTKLGQMVPCKDKDLQNLKALMVERNKLKGSS